MLSKKEKDLATKILDNERLPYATPEEALELANVKIITNNLSLLYVINIPITTNETFEKIIIKPVKKNNVMIEIENNTILRSQDKFYSVIKDCIDFNSLSICKQINVKNISNSSCIPNLLKSSNSTCSRIKGQNIPTLEEISPGILLLNEFNGVIQINNVSRDLSGTYLIKFNNATIVVNNKTFTAIETSSLRILPAIMQPTPQENRYREILSLEVMKELHLNNTSQIKLLKNETKIERWANYGFTSILLVTLIIVIIHKIKIRGKTKVIINQVLEDKTATDEK